MLNAGERMFAYPFEGYWKDVGTIDSLWEANMDLLDPNVTLDLKDIYSRNPMMPPHFVSNDAVIQNSLVADGCNVYGNLEFSILSRALLSEKALQSTLLSLCLVR